MIQISVLNILRAPPIRIHLRFIKQGGWDLLVSEGDDGIWWQVRRLDLYGLFSMRFRRKLYAKMGCHLENFVSATKTRNIFINGLLQRLEYLVLVYPVSGHRRQWRRHQSFNKFSNKWDQELAKKEKLFHKTVVFLCTRHRPNTFFVFSLNLKEIMAVDLSLPNENDSCIK